jgi:hypothetical protein
MRFLGSTLVITDNNLGNFFFRTPNQFCRDHLRTEQDIRKRIFASNRQLKTPRPKFFDFLTDVRFTGN